MRRIDKGAGQRVKAVFKVGQTAGQSVFVKWDAKNRKDVLMWLHDCEAKKASFLCDKSCSQPAIMELAGYKLCINHFNAAAKIRIKIRKDGHLVKPRGLK